MYDNSVYPVVFITYAAAGLEEAGFPPLVGWSRVAVTLVLALALAYLNYRGLSIVSSSHLHWDALLLAYLLASLHVADGILTVRYTCGYRILLYLMDRSLAQAD